MRDALPARITPATAPMRTAVEERARTGPRQAPLPESESRAWLSALLGSKDAHDDAVRRLHALLVNAARFEVGRRRSALADLGDEQIDAIATEAADEALVSVLSSLGDFDATRRFSTWASKFALLAAAVKVRRRSWLAREEPVAPDRWAPLRVLPATTDEGEDLERGRLLEVLQRAIDESLTPHQRDVLVALALDGVPIDVLADTLASSRGALYETLREARRTLRLRLGESGIGLHWLDTSPADAHRVRLAADKPPEQSVQMGAARPRLSTG